MEQYIQLKCLDEYSIYLPRPVAELSLFLKKEISEIVKKRTFETENDWITIELLDIKPQILETVIEYWNHKYYYEHMKDINQVINEDYQIDPKIALDVLIATVKLQC